jgi:hypothetical protein
MGINESLSKEAQHQVRSLRGLYVQCLSDGKLLSVAVEDEGGGHYSLAPSEYRKRCIVPQLEDLPDFTAYIGGLAPIRSGKR